MVQEEEEGVSHSQGEEVAQMTVLGDEEAEVAFDRQVVVHSCGLVAVHDWVRDQYLKKVE